MKKLVALIVVVIVVGAAWLAGGRGATPITDTAQTHILNGTPSAQGFHYAEHEKYFTIDADYPATTSLVAAADAKARMTIEQGLATQIADFKQNSGLENLTPKDIEVQGLGDDRKYALGMEYKEYASTNYISYVYTVYEDTLGAHPNSYYTTFVFDRAGNKVELADLFKAGSNYLNVLSAEAYKQVLAELKTRTDGEVSPDMLDTARIGTSPTPETLQFFYINGDQLVILFPPYQVAAYAAGSFEAHIPLTTLKDILK
jgi:hypothetical protein